MGNGKGVGTKIMFGTRIGIRLLNLGWKLGLEIWDKDWDGYEDGDWGRIRFMLGIGSRGYGLGLKL